MPCGVSALTPPDYAHIATLNFPDGTKLSKQTGAPPLDDTQATRNLAEALRYLGNESPGRGDHRGASRLGFGALVARARAGDARPLRNVPSKLTFAKITRHDGCSAHRLRGGAPRGHRGRTDRPGHVRHPARRARSASPQSGRLPGRARHADRSRPRGDRQRDACHRHDGERFDPTSGREHSPGRQGLHRVPGRTGPSRRCNRESRRKRNAAVERVDGSIPDDRLVPGHAADQGADRQGCAHRPRPC